MGQTVTCFGIKWICMAIIIPLPWSKRPWALPFFTVLAPSKEANEKAKKRHKTILDFTLQMVKQVSRWLTHQHLILIGDGCFGCHQLGLTCIDLGYSLISRLRLNAQLYDFPPKPKAGQRGRRRIIGKRQPLLKTLVDQDKCFTDTGVKWYGCETKTVKLLSGICLWYGSGVTPIPVKWVLVIGPNKAKHAEAFFSTDLAMEPKRIVEFFTMRWNIEVTFQESRQYLGFETQRQWTDKAIARSSPLIFALYSIVTLIANNLQQTYSMLVKDTAWYVKDNTASFSDVLTFVKHTILQEKYFYRTDRTYKVVKIKCHNWEELIYQLALAA